MAKSNTSSENVIIFDERTLFYLGHSLTELVECNFLKAWHAVKAFQCNLVEYIDREALTYNFGPTVTDCPVFIFCSWNIKEKFGIASRHYWALLQAPFIIISNSCSAYNLAWSNWKTYELFIIMNINSKPFYLQEQSPLKLMGYKNIPLQFCHWIH